MKKLKLLKDNDIAVQKEHSIYCDFCGDEGKEVFTSSYDSHLDSSKNESQICIDCVKQLAKLI
jgi:hypothetical protein